MVNNFVINKIKKIRSLFKLHDWDPIKILAKLIPKPKSKFRLKTPTVQRVRNFISKFKISNAAGFDNVSIKVFKS